MVAGRWCLAQPMGMDMAKRGKWYQQGHDDATSGIGFDPPWLDGHRDHRNYCEGYADGERLMVTEARALPVVAR